MKPTRHTLLMVRFLIILLTLCFSGKHLLIAGITGKIAGKVIDSESGEPLIGANVVISATIRDGREIPLENLMGAACDLNGEYFIINVPPGAYVVKASMMGYTSVNKTDVRVRVDYTTPVDFTLTATTIELDEIRVVADREIIKHDLTASAASVNAETIEMLPVNSVGEILDLQAGLVRDSDGQLHIRGGRATEVGYMIDGVQVSDPVNRTSGLTVDNQAIEEVQTLMGTFNAEYGQALSGIVNIVTKRGSDRFTGNVLVQFGDYLSFDDLYSVTNDQEWMEGAAQSLAYADLPLFYQGEIYQEGRATRPALPTEKYLQSYNPLKNTDLQANISGPIPGTGKNLTYFVSGRFLNYSGHQMGKRYFMPWGLSAPALDTTNNVYDLPDQKLVPFGDGQSYSLQSKIYWRLGNRLTINYGLFWQDQSNRGSNYMYKYVPDGVKNYYNDNLTHILTLTHTLSARTFYELRLSNLYKKHENYLYEDTFDYRYISNRTTDFEQYVLGSGFNPSVALATIPYDLQFWGNENDRYKNIVKYNVLKFDLTSQVTKRHQIKLGAEATLYDIEDEYISLQFDDVDFRPLIMPLGSAYHNYYQHKPKLFSVYLQDKTEFKEIIFNIGVRYDYFDPDGKILTDPADPQIYNPFNPAHVYKDYYPGIPQDSLEVLLRRYTVEERSEFWFQDVKAKHQISPRFGIAFPVSDRGNIHFAYGHFFQVPAFRFLYENPEFEIYGADAQNLIGNADLNPERTVSYELGLQQALSDNFHFTLVGYYRDIRDWITTSPAIDTYGGRTTYVKYINKDFGNAQGIELSANYHSPNVLMSLDYTLMVAEGTNSDPRDAYYAMRENEEPQIQLIPMNWDRSHSLNVILTYRNRGWIASFIGQAFSGFPYTPTFRRGEVAGGSLFRGIRTNSARRPTTYNVDLKLSKMFRLNQFEFDVFVNVFNVFDRRNPNNVYSDTGRADYTLEGVTQQNRVISIADVEEYYARPGMYSPPRHIQLGLKFSF